MYELTEENKGRLALMYMLLSLMPQQEQDFIKVCQAVEIFSSPEELKKYIDELQTSGRLDNLIHKLQGRKD